MPFSYITVNGQQYRKLFGTNPEKKIALNPTSFGDSNTARTHRSFRLDINESTRNGKSLE